MSVNYDLYETPDLTKSGEEQPLHARVVLKGSYTAEEFVEQVVALQHMPHAQVVGVIEAISKELRHLLLKGFSVELGDVGYFNLSLSVDKKVMEAKDLRSPSVSLKDINFRVNRQFKKDLESQIELQRYHSPFRVKNPLDRERCLQRLEKFLEDHPCINRQDYAMLVGKTKIQALQDINAFIKEGVLKKYGLGRSVVYIKAE
ncbi:DNA-binding protein [Bacteroides xylanisolvens]|uniref:DNA-binding protein n=1 Tax=Bacteroides xylanisolvens TaxID=371601 RepID=A0AAW4T1Z8_9BACE|nr:DNA-binding protein [Bacteroides xylanisolvens]MCA4533577.1 DNA-binding protein [Bacteroides xylanisolvens]MCA4551571.1 DNA-binding protein [Bacteroides xylanisolvens]MCA4565121.1 DNA-binding protein [Bacteroides xylanisolvens]MCA4570140.1 DNA-binding protein [Bacteroides xylanisolvens]MCA4600795.1 DNA-binding protein [Bacteroides xylanisolvens]